MIGTKNGVKTVSVSIPKKLLERARAAAKSLDLSLSGLISEALAGHPQVTELRKEPR
jgi:post-segregation antitoxin (ccd killing protein)